MLNLILGHFVGDFMFQCDWMANNKKQNSLICALHCLIYSLIIWAFTFFTWPLWSIGVVFLTHFIIDRTLIVKHYLLFMGQKRFIKGELFPWAYIIVDNTWHMLALWGLSYVV